MEQEPKPQELKPAEGEFKIEGEVISPEMMKKLDELLKQNKTKLN